MFSRRSSIVPNGSPGYEHSRQGACVERSLAKVCSPRSFNYYSSDLRLCFISLNSIVSFVNTYAAPVGISNASWRFYFLYLVVDAVGILVIYLTFVETRGRSLEEMDVIFGAVQAEDREANIAKEEHSKFLLPCEPVLFNAK